MSKTALFQTIPFSISTQFSFIWPIARTPLGATTPGEREPESDGNEGVHRFPQSSSIMGAWPLDGLVSYPRHSLVEVLHLCIDAVSVFYRSSRRGYVVFDITTLKHRTTWISFLVL